MPNTKLQNCMVSARLIKGALNNYNQTQVNFVINDLQIMNKSSFNFKEIKTVSYYSYNTIIYSPSTCLFSVTESVIYRMKYRLFSLRSHCLQIGLEVGQGALEGQAT